MNSSSKKSSSPLANKPLPISLFQSSDDNSNVDDDATTSDDEMRFQKNNNFNDDNQHWDSSLHWVEIFSQISSSDDVNM